MNSVPDYFGSLVFDDRAMKAKLPFGVYDSLRKTIDEGANLNTDVANAVADAMKDWAVEHGATHFTHWFQPQRGGTAEKHDAFINYSDSGEIIERFSAKQLIQSEPAHDSIQSPAGKNQTPALETAHYSDFLPMRFPQKPYISESKTTQYERLPTTNEIALT